MPTFKVKNNKDPFESEWEKVGEQWMKHVYFPLSETKVYDFPVIFNPKLDVND